MDTNRLAAGFGWGVVGAIAMGILTVIGLVTGLSPIPKPIPAALVAETLKELGVTLPRPAIVGVAVTSHFLYGGFWGAALAALTRPVTIWKGIGLGVFLWLGMQVVVFPFLDWGFFGVARTPWIAVATLVLHLVYGTTLGLLMDLTRPSREQSAFGQEQTRT